MTTTRTTLQQVITVAKAHGWTVTRSHLGGAIIERTNRYHGHELFDIAVATGTERLMPTLSHQNIDGAIKKIATYKQVVDEIERLA